MINISEKDLDIIKNIFKMNLPFCEVRAFGSRYRGTNKEFSDLDLAITYTDLSLEILCKLEEAFENSELGYRVDLIDYVTVSKEFKEVIDAGNEKVYGQ